MIRDLHYRTFHFIGTFALLSVFLASKPASAAVANGQASAEVLAALVVTETQSLSFGSIQTGNTGGAVVISTIGDRSPIGGVNLGPEIGTQAQFDIAGTVSATISVGTISGINLASGGNTMPVAFNTTGAPTSLDGNGQAVLNVGATLTVPANQEPGGYIGSFTVTVSYN